MERGVYRRYRGSRRRIGVLVPTLIALCVLAAVFLIYLKFNLTQTETGEMALKLPFSSETVTFGEPEPEEVNLIIEEPVDIYVEPEVPEYQSRIEKPTFVSREMLFDAAAFDKMLASVKESDINTVIFPIKVEDGTVLLNEENIATVEEALNKVKEAGLNAVAQISCFKDNLMPREDHTLSCKTENRLLWIDENKITWLSPYIPEARAYIKEVVTSACEIGFNEVLLTNVTFPIGEETKDLHFKEEEEKQSAINAFLDEMKALRDSKENFNIAIRYDESDAEESGVVLSEITKRFYRVYVNDIYNNVETLLNEEERKTRIVVAPWDEFKYVEKEE